MVGLLHGVLTSAGTMRLDGGLTWGLLAPARRFNGSCSSGHRQLLRPCVAELRFVTTVINSGRVKFVTAE